MKRFIVLLLFTIFIFIGAMIVPTLQRGNDKAVLAEELPMSTVNALKLQTSSLEIALLQEKQRRAQDRQTLIRVLDLWEQGISYADADKYKFDPRTFKFTRPARKTRSGGEEDPPEEPETEEDPEEDEAVNN